MEVEVAREATADRRTTHRMACRSVTCLYSGGKDGKTEEGEAWRIPEDGTDRKGCSHGGRFGKEKTENGRVREDGSRKSVVGSR